MAAQSRGVQALFEKHLEMPAWGLAAFSGIAKAASFYSSGSFSLPRFLGVFGMFWFNLFTGLGLAFGLDVVMGIAGRQERYYQSQRLEAEGRKGMPARERAALVQMFAEKERQNRFYKRVGMAGSFVACVAFFLVSNTDHSFVAIINEVAVGALQVATVYYLAVVKESKGADDHERMQEQSLELRLKVQHEAGLRIAAGTHTDQDLRIYADGLPKRDRSQFIGAFTRVEDGDQMWTARQIAEWIGYAPDDLSARRKIQRRLSTNYGGAYSIVKRPDTQAYEMPKSAAARLFFDDFTAVRSGLVVAAHNDNQATIMRHRKRLHAVETERDSDSDTTATAARLAPDMAKSLLMPGTAPAGLAPLPVVDQGGDSGRHVELL